jgi:hypothetical protein
MRSAYAQARAARIRDRNGESDFEFDDLPDFD